MLKELLKENRSYRKFDATFEIKREDLTEIINNLRHIPTARNQQVLMYKPIVEKQIRDLIFPQLKWAGYIEDWNGPEENQRPTGYILIGVNKDRCIYNDKWVYADLGIATQSILLQAVEKGLNGCAIGAIIKSNIAKIIDLPDNIELELVIALGKKAQKIEIVDVKEDNDIKYFVKDNVHCVPKRDLKDILF